jgi:hypothetical protein
MCLAVCSALAAAPLCSHLARVVPLLLLLLLILILLFLAGSKAVCGLGCPGSREKGPSHLQTSSSHITDQNHALEVARLVSIE